VDATHLAHRIFKVHEEVPVKAGPPDPAHHSRRIQGKNDYLSEVLKAR